MCPSIAVDERIARARELSGDSAALPWQSFAEFYRARVYDPDLIKRTFLTYYDDDRQIRRSYTYGEFNALVQKVAAFLHDRLGLVRGDRLATILSNHDITVLVYFAAWTLGLAVVPINAEEAPEKKRYILEHSEASAVLCWRGLFEELKQHQGELPALSHVVALEDATEHGSFMIAEHAGQDRASRHVPALPPHLQDEALIVYTSGTTGPPKGVVLTAENLLIDADAISQWHRFGPQDRLMCVLPIHHVNGIVVTLVTPFFCKGTAVLSRKFKSSLFWRRLHEEQVTCVSVVPTLLEFLLEADEDLAPYRLEQFGGFICGAGPLLKDTAARFEDRFGFLIRHGYGLSEATCYSCFLPNDLSPEEHRRWLTAYEFPSIGVPLRHNLMTILDQSGASLPELARGEICIKGGTVCGGYFNRPDANEAAFKWGWFRTGDEGYFVKDDQGRPFFFISGRLKELIIRGGVNISPLEIDEVLRGHPGVKFAMAVPFEHRFYGEEIAAYVVPGDGLSDLTPNMLEEFCRSRLPFWKRPKVILFGQDVPYTSTGKPKRLELKAKLAAELVRYRDHQFKDVG